MKKDTGPTAQRKKIQKGTLFASFDPSNEQIIWEGYEANAAAVDAAFKNARKAFGEW
ncbi:MAG: hypothetical protein H0X29_04455, partial [Parachlamydiaceae bacterium]|nr:hypothetical protein [Parachlamydiaceae bacterium]